MEPSKKPLCLSWLDLSYQVSDKGLRSSILQTQSGYIMGGQLTAIMGPSGAGKTTLVNCILGKATQGNIGGRIEISNSSKPVNVRSVPQKNSIFEQFTAFENLLFCSKIHFGSLSATEHHEKVETILKELDLESSRDTATSKLSGGQMKRLTIGLEILSDPDILILDEPTTGLDSTTAMTCINVLKNLAKKKYMAVMAIIHQPSNEVFTTFDMLYLLSNAGEKLFFGPPDQLLPLFLSLDIECPKKQSIPELAIKVANSGLKDALLAEKLDTFRKCPNEGNALNTLIIQAVFSWRHVGLLLSRAFISLNFRSPFLAITILFHVASALMVAFSTKIPFGLIDGCQVSINGTLSRDELKMTYVDQLEANNTLKAFVVSPVFYLLIVIPVISAIRFPLEFRVMRRELDNKWYSTSSYVTAKVLGSISECVLLTPVFAGILFYFSEQRVEAWRAVSWLSIIILSSIYNFVVGLLCGVVFKDDLEMAVLTSVLNFFTFIVSKCFVNTQHMSAVFQYLLPLNVFDLAVSATASVMYGFGRCPPPPTDAVSLYEVMSDSRNPYKVISKAYEDANFTNEYVTTVANILDVDDQKLPSLKVSLDEYFTRQPKPKSAAVASYVLEYLGIDNDGRECWRPVALMVLHIVFIISISYFKLSKH